MLAYWLIQRKDKFSWSTPWRSVTTEVRLLSSHQQEEGGVVYPLDIYISKRWLPGPRERHACATKRAKGLSSSQSGFIRISKEEEKTLQSQVFLSKFFFLPLLC